MKKTIDLESAYLDLLRSIINSYLPHAKVWVFGSRVTGKAKPYSDIDLAIDAEKDLSIDVLAGLSNAFEESNLPYKVDIVDWQTIDHSFREKIKNESVLLP